MKLVLEVTSDHGGGKRTWLLPGQMIDVGRTEHASFVVDNDPLMAPIHFVVTCGNAACTLRDLDTEQGTWVNGRRVKEVQLSDADRIEAGRTRLLVHIEGDGVTQQPTTGDSAATINAAARGGDPHSADTPLAVVGSWRIHRLPPNWSFVEGSGLLRHGSTRSIAGGKLREQLMPGDVSLEGFVNTMSAWISELGLEQPPRVELEIQGAEKAVRTELRFARSHGASFVQTQICAVKGRWLGFATFIMPADVRLVAEVDQVLEGLAFLPDESPPPQNARQEK